MWDAIVIGSGMGGLVAAAALARCARRVLVLEQHTVAGGLTQTFRRGDWTFATGVHYVSGVGPHGGPDGQFGRLLHWLTAGALSFADCGNPYDMIRLPGLEFAIHHPQAAYRQALELRFPAQRRALGEWFAQLDAANRAARSLLVRRALPPWMAWSWNLVCGASMRRLSECTLAQALAQIDDARLRALLATRWGDYGVPPAAAPLLEHAQVMGAYDGGAYYPVGGPARFLDTLQPVIEGAGGQVRTGATVTRILVRNGRASAVVFEQRGRQHTEQARHVISAMGVINTVGCLDPKVAPAWRAAIDALRPGLSYLALYLGFDGDIGAAGATTANVWIYETEDVGRVWQEPDREDAPALFVSFPSLKDPSHRGRHTAEVLALCGSQAFAAWRALPAGQRPPEYLALKAAAERRLLAQFARHFPALMPLLGFHELSTPLTQQHFVHSPAGAMYGVEMTSRRLHSRGLDVRTPVPGLLLAGQDVSGPGIQAAGLSGLLAAAAIQPRLLRRLFA